MSRLIKIGSVALAAVALLSTGCGQERPPRSFVQPNAIAKSDLTGTWYFLQTVTNAPATSSFMFIGDSSDLMKVRFDIEEDTLFARRAYEQIIGSEDAASQNPEEYAGQPLAAWKISSQFDIIRQYNSTTGEETNQIIESQERPWNEREYIRVDWSQNLITDYVGLGLNFFFAEGTSVEPVSYWESDPTKPDAFHMERADPNTDPQFQAGEANYFDITNEIVVTPNVQTECYTENGAQSCFTIPICFLAYKLDDCASQIVKTRNSFMKIPTNHDFQPRQWDGLQMDQFGIWDVGLERLTYNRQYGITNAGLIRHAAKFNVWGQSHVVQACATNTDCTAAGTSCSTSDKSVSGLYSVLGTGASAKFGTGNAGACVDTNGVRQFLTCNTNMDCGNTTNDPTGSTCDTNALNAPQGGGFCTVPYAQRPLVTHPYYAESSDDEYQVESSDPSTQLTPFPSTLFPVGQQIIANWNSAVKAAVADVYGQAPQQDLFVWCHNPVQLLPPGANAATWTGTDGTPADPAACVGNIKPQLDGNGNPVLDQYGNQIFKARQGDPRRSNIFWVNEMQAAGPLGYGPPLFDPETGETISGQAYIYGAALDTYAARSRDIVLLLLGKIDSTQYVLGTNVADWVTATRSGVLDRSPTYSQDDVKRRFAAMDFSWARGVAPAARIDDSSFQALVTSLNNRENAVYQSGVFGTSNADMSTLRRSQLMNSPLEAMMITPDVLDMGGAQPGSSWDQLSDGEKMRVSPLRTSVVRTAQAQQNSLMQTLGVDFDDFADEGMIQRAIQLSRDPNLQNLNPQLILDQLTKDIFFAVTLHECGHNMGLRHNFRSSFDSMNYFPEYWQLRTSAANNLSAHKYVGFDSTAVQPITTGTYGGTDCVQKKGTVRPRYVDCQGGATSVEEVTGCVGTVDSKGNCMGTALPGGVREYQYTSIMDYGAEFNSDFQGLGHYDKAAMKFSYAGDGYVEVFPNSQPVSVNNVTTPAGNTWTAIHTFQTGFGAPSPLGSGSGLSAITYGQYPTLFQNGSPDLEVRKDVPYSQIVDIGSPPDPTNPGNNTHLYVWNDPSSGAQYPMVPYFFCSDEYVGNLTCQRFDSGADAFEQAQDLISRYQNFYLYNDFKRDRFTFYSSLAYQDRIEGRYLDMLREQLTWYSLFRSDFEQYVFEAATSLGTTDPEKYLTNFFTDENGWGNFTVGVTMGFDLLGNIITQPNAGIFVPLTASQTTDSPYGYYQQISDSLIPSNGALNLGLLSGKYINTTWDFAGCGYYWYDECETRIGYFRDKIFALDELTQSQAYFTGRDTSTDVRTYAIGYITPFRAQIEEKIGALLAGDYASLAPYTPTGATGTPVQDSWTLDNEGANKTPTDIQQNLIDPSTGFTLQLYAGVYGLSSFPTTFDQSFITTTKIFVVGNGEAPVPDTLLMNPDQSGSIATTNPAKLIANGGTAQYFVWNDVDFGTTYAAVSVAPAQVPQTATAAPIALRNDSGARMLENAAAIQGMEVSACNLPNGPPTDLPQCEAKQIALEHYRENIQMMRSLHNAYGYGVYKTDAPFYY